MNYEEHLKVVLFFPECVCCNGAELWASKFMTIDLHFAVSCKCLSSCKIPLLTSVFCTLKLVICLLPNKVRMLLEERFTEVLNIREGLKMTTEFCLL